MSQNWATAHSDCHFDRTKNLVVVNDQLDLDGVFYTCQWNFYQNRRWDLLQDFANEWKSFNLDSRMGLKLTKKL